MNGMEQQARYIMNRVVDPGIAILQRQDVIGPYE